MTGDGGVTGDTCHAQLLLKCPTLHVLDNKKMETISSALATVHEKGHLYLLHY